MLARNSNHTYSEWMATTLKHKRSPSDIVPSPFLSKPERECSSRHGISCISFRHTREQTHMMRSCAQTLIHCALINFATADRRCVVVVVVVATAIERSHQEAIQRIPFDTVRVHETMSPVVCPKTLVIWAPYQSFNWQCRRRRRRCRTRKTYTDETRTRISNIARSRIACGSHVRYVVGARRPVR